MRLVACIVHLVVPFAAVSAIAQTRVVVTPVQGDAARDMAIEIEEAMRQGAIQTAKDRSLLVMTRKTMETKLLEFADTLKAAGVSLPCKTPECDATTATSLGADLALSSKLVKVDDNYVLLLKLVGDGGALKGSTAIEQKTLGGMLAAAPGAAQKLLADNLVAAKPPLDTRAIRKRGYLVIGRAGDLFGGSYADCELYVDRLSCQHTGLFSDNKTELIRFSDVANVAAGDDEVLLQMTWNLQQRLSMVITKTQEQHGTLAVELERQRNRQAIAEWRIAIEQAFAEFKKSK
jgi:hypothetical protein